MSRCARYIIRGESSRAGDFLRQLVERDGEWVGLFVCGPSALKFKAPKMWTGWNAAMAAERFKLIVQNRRYLLLVERGHEPNPASAALASACRALSGQWRESLGCETLLAESFTDPESYKDICYKASGWETAGMSAGSSRARPDFYVPNGKPKCLWLRELRSGKMLLCQAQRRSLMEVLRQPPDPMGRNTRFRSGPVLSIVTMGLLCGARQISEIALFGSKDRHSRCSPLPERNRTQ